MSIRLICQSDWTATSLSTVEEIGKMRESTGKKKRAKQKNNT